MDTAHLLNTYQKVLLLSSSTVAVIGKRHFGNPIPQEWYAAAADLLASITLHNGWNSLIDQAPRDGTEILVARADLPADQFMTIAFWCKTRSSWCLSEHTKLEWQPTHWRHRLTRPRPATE